MAGLWAYAAAGAAAGAGKGLVEEAKAAREEALEAVRFERQRVLAGEDREFRSGEAEKDRGFRREERIDGQAFSASENAKSRGASAGLAAARNDLALRLAEIADARDQRRMEVEGERFDRTFEAGREDARADREWRESQSEREASRIGSTFTDDEGTLRGLSPTGTARPITDPDTGAPVRPAPQNTGPERARVYAETLRAMQSEVQMGQTTAKDAIAYARRVAGYDDGSTVDVSGIPEPALKALLADPALKDQFDQKYGRGAAAAVLGD